MDEEELENQESEQIEENQEAESGDEGDFLGDEPEQLSIDELSHGFMIFNRVPYLWLTRG